MTDSQTENVYYISADITSQPENPGKGKNAMLNQLNLIKPSVLQTGRRPARRQRRVVLWQKDQPMRTICTQTLYIGGSQSGSRKSRDSSSFNHATTYGANSVEENGNYSFHISNEILTKPMHKMDQERFQNVPGGLFE